MTTTTSISYQDARNLLIATSVNHGERGIGTPSTDRRNYSLTEALACLANSRNYRTQDTNGIVTLTSTGAFGDYVWYLDTEPRRDPWA